MTDEASSIGDAVCRGASGGPHSRGSHLARCGAAVIRYADAISKDVVSRPHSLRINEGCGRIGPNGNRHFEERVRCHRRRIRRGWDDDCDSAFTDGAKVLLLEQAQTIGGLTHAFSRNGFTWDVGLHYCGTFGRDQLAGRILNWLSGGTIEFHSVGTVYDILHFPDGFEIPVGRPADAYKMELKEQFPDSASEIDDYFEALFAAEETMQSLASEPARRSPRSWWKTGRPWACARALAKRTALRSSSRLSAPVKQ